MSLPIDPLEGSLISIPSDMESFIADPPEHTAMVTNTPSENKE